MTVQLPIRFRNIFFILIGSFIFAFGVYHFNVQNNLAEGGFTGITLILRGLFDWSPSITNLALNIPLFFVSYKLLGRTTFIYTLIGTFSFSLWYALIAKYSNLIIDLTDDMVLASLFAGLFIGVGLGIIFNNGGTTGGVDIIARLVQRYVGWSIGKTFLVFDFFVIVLSLTYLDYREAMYTLLAVYIGARVIDSMQEGTYAGKAAMIISDHRTAIADGIHATMNRGTTRLLAKGGYSNKELEVLYVVVGRNEVNRLKTIVRQIDPHAFVTFHHVYEVGGEGFTFDENRVPLK
ncbi:MULTISPECIES: YitT family protein [Exiguobacterium]|uniref:YitT family protein n=1 Tax=Exiguobacterium TaxID=33986 RepID=UPI001BEBF245|nr:MULTISPECIES: YitT family protein [Exiguobacterium]MCT4775954.1 YitT family protein [Exiguobacterium aquaticum]MCT4788387.1 YitT family protein [Exiguobacterium mexicanum]